MSQVRIGIIIGSTRPGRNGEQVAKWVYDHAVTRDDAAFELVDLADYQLPHDGYNETCAALALMMWNHRMFLLTGEAKYMDVFERTAYNGFLSGVSTSGDRFFYPNPLVYDGAAKNNNGFAGRAPWFGCACCPPNLMRTLASLTGYFYAIHQDALYVNFYAQSEGEAKIGRAVDAHLDAPHSRAIGEIDPCAMALRVDFDGKRVGSPQALGGRAVCRCGIGVAAPRGGIDRADRLDGHSAQCLRGMRQRVWRFALPRVRGIEGDEHRNCQRRTRESVRYGCVHASFPFRRVEHKGSARATESPLAEVVRDPLHDQQEETGTDDERRAEPDRDAERRARTPRRDEPDHQEDRDDPGRRNRRDERRRAAPQARQPHQCNVAGDHGDPGEAEAERDGAATDRFIGGNDTLGHVHRRSVEVGWKGCRVAGMRRRVVSRGARRCGRGPRRVFCRGRRKAA